MRTGALLAVLGLLLAGCLSGSPSLREEAAQPPQSGEVKWLGEGRTEIYVPVPIVLVGFSEGMAEAVQGQLPSSAVNASVFSGGLVPLSPMPEYQVIQAPDSVSLDLKAFLENARVEGPSGAIYDANQVEDWLMETLPSHGVTPTPDLPAMVLLHLGEETQGEHAYRYSYPQGWLEPVRVFGERTPLLVMDVSARGDPYVVGDTDEPTWETQRDLYRARTGEDIAKAYDFPLPPGGEDAVAALVEAVVDATRMRLLEGPAYPVSTRGCHAVTAVVGVREGALTPRLEGYSGAEDLLDSEGLLQALQKLAPEAVTFDAKVILLPRDDPELDLMLRVGDSDSEAFREWADANWQKYWIEHAGCEAYLSFLIFGDAADWPDSRGTAWYDVDLDRRISFSVVAELDRIQGEYAGPAEEFIGTRPESHPAYNRTNRLLLHETGHLFGLPHPHETYLPDGTTYFVASFSSIWSSMSYQTGDRIIEFSAIDRANHMRNRVGYLLQAYHDEESQASEAFQAVLQHLAAYRWQEAGDLLATLL